MVKQFLKFGIIMMLSGLSITLAAQTVITGAVYDNTGESLPGAAIILSSTSEGTVTDLDGNFELEVNKTGDLSLMFSFIGYNNKTVNVTVADGETVDLGKVILETSDLMLDAVEVIASVAKDRETPVTISSIKPEMIAEKLGAQEFPEILKSTPSIYATKEGGGFGDSRITMRGFDSNNIGILINGIPVNDMETGKVYWSNWAGLSDVTRSMQVQRGLGASKLAVPSVGGTMNIITNSTNATKGGSAGVWMGNDGYLKESISLSTGVTENGWAMSLAGSHTTGDGYIQGTSFEGWNYFLNISKRINDKQSLSFTAFGAPQEHDQRKTQHTIEQYEENGLKWNSDFGYRNGEEFTTGHNRYHKPQLSLNHFWQIDETSKLTTSAYASISTGGGQSVDGDNDHYLEYEYGTGAPAVGTKLTAEGYLDYDAVIAENAALAAAGQGGSVYLTESVNSHQWYGLLTNYEKDIDNLKLTGGFDGRYYKGNHTKEITDLMGADYIIDDSNINDSHTEQVKRVGDKVQYNNPGEVLYAGLFGQGEYVTDRWSAFASLSGAANEYRRTDYFGYSGDEQVTDWQNFWTWTTKGGANYNINTQHNVYGNLGYISRAPYFKNSYIGYTNEENGDATNEKIFTTELGYGYQTRTVNIKSNIYYTQWKDKGLIKTLGDNETVNIPGINEVHYGFELEGEWRPTSELTVRGMLSIGNWYYSDNVNFELYDEDRNLVDTYDAYIKDVHVGDAAQTTAMIGVDYEFLPKFKIGVDVNYAGRNYAYFDPTNRTSVEDQVDSWEMPSYTTVDLNMNYRFKMGGLDATWYSNINNLLNAEYVADATDGGGHDANSALVYYGFGTTWSTGLKVKF